MSIPYPQVRPMAITTGGQLDLVDVAGRDATIARWWADLEQGSLRLNEPRRLGKSAALALMVSRPPAGWQAVYTSFQDINTVADMVATTLTSLAGLRGRGVRIADRVKQYLSGFSVEMAGAAVTLNPAFARRPLDALTAALDDVIEHLDGEQLLLAWDEVPDMVRGIRLREGEAAAREMLLGLRRYLDGSGGRRIRWIMTGSVGFHHVLHDLPGTDSLVNNLGSAVLGPLDPGWARWLAASLYAGAGVAVDAAALDQAAVITDGIPFLIQHLAKFARDSRLTSVIGVDLQIHLDAYASSEDRSQQLTPMLTRLSDYYGDDAEVAEWLLDRIAAAPRSRTELVASAGAMTLPSDSRLRRILTNLKLDHYLEQDLGGPARFHWKYPALARFWRTRRR